MKASGKYLLGMTLAAMAALAATNTQAALATAAETDFSQHPKVRDLIPYRRVDASTAAIQIARHGQEDDKSNRRQRPRNLSPEQRERVEQGRQRFQALPQQDKERIQDARKRYRALPANERERLRQQWQQRQSQRGRSRGGEDRKAKQERDR